MELTTKEVLRYQRHIRLDGFGKANQLKLKQSRVLIVGAGGLGCPAGLYLAAAGVGHIRICDGDHIELSNLQRQIAHRSQEVGRNKSESLAERMLQINGDIEVIAEPLHIDEDNVVACIQGYDLVIDGSDNFRTRYLLSDHCHKAGIVYIYGAIQQFEGQISVFDSRNGPCYRCLFPEPPPRNLIPSCEQAGVLGVLPGTIGLAMATEAIKVLTGLGQTLQGHVLIYDALEPSYRKIHLHKDPHCRLCGDGELTLSEPVIAESDGVELDVRRAHEMKQQGVSFLDVRDDIEVELCHIEGARHIPMPELMAGLEELDSQCEWVVFCYDGIRSYRAVKLMREFGFERVWSMAGGIKDWAEHIEPDMVRY